MVHFMNQFINKIIQMLGRKDYEVDEYLTSRDIIYILLGKFSDLFRGLYLRMFLKQCGGLIFLGKNCQIKFCNKISVGKTIVIGDGVEINALSKFGIKVGNNFSIHRNSIIECTGIISELGEGLTIGDNVGFAQNCFIQVRGKVEIGNNVIFGPAVSIFSENHLSNDLNKYINQQGTSRKGVVIEEGVWVGTRAVILDGVTVGRNSIVAAGSIVTKDVPPNTIVGGIPAHIIKERT